MSSRGTSNAFDRTKDPFGCSSSAEEINPIHPVQECTARMLNALAKINLDDPQRRLSDDKLRELDVQGVIDYATNELKSSPIVSEFDLTKLDNDIIYIIGALEVAVRDGLESTAEWACTALFRIFKNLCIKFDNINAEYPDALMGCRVDFFANLKLLVQSAIERDRTKQELDAMIARWAAKRKDMDTCKNSFLARRDAGLLNALLAEIQQKANRPGDLSNDAVALRDELYAMHWLKASLVEMEDAISAKLVSLIDHDTEIQNHLNTLAAPPQVADPQLQAKLGTFVYFFRVHYNPDSVPSLSNLLSSVDIPQRLKDKTLDILFRRSYDRFLHKYQIEQTPAPETQEIQNHSEESSYYDDLA